MQPKMKTIFAILTCLALLTAASAQVMINEFYYDNPGGEDESVKFIEIYGPPGTNLDGWSITATNGNGGTEYLSVQLEGDIPDDGYFVIGGSNVENVDQQANVELQNAGYQADNDCDGVQLRDTGGAVVDAVCYGVCADGHICNGEGDPAPDYDPPSAGPAKSIARIPDHSDTDDNATDFLTADNLTPGAPNEGEPCDPLTVGLDEIRVNDANGVPDLDGVFVITEGIVNIDNLLLQEFSSFFIQDDDAGCNIFGGNAATTIAEGDCVRVSGWVSSFRGLTEIVSSGAGNCIFQVDVIGHVDAPEPALLTGGSFFESYEGMLVKFEGVTITGGDAWPSEGNDATITVTDGQGTFTLRIDKETEVDGMDEPGGSFDLTGIMTQYDFEAPYDDFYQVIPRYRSDIAPLAADDPIDNALPAEFRLDGAFPNPFNSTTNLRFAVGSASELTVHVFDLLGREVATEKLMGLTPGSHVWNWTPTGATGLYIVRMESQNIVETAKLLYLK